ICDDYDLCAVCLEENKHDNHAFDRLLNGDTEIKILNEFNRALAKDTHHCTPIFVVKSRNGPGKGDAEKVMNKAAEYCNAELSGSEKRLMDIHDLFKQEEKERKEVEKIKKKDAHNSKRDKKEIAKEEKNEKREYSRAEMMSLNKKQIWCLESDSDCDDYSDDSVCRYSDEESDEYFLEAVIKSLEKQRERPIAEAVADESAAQTERPPSHFVTDDQLINLDDEPQSLEVPFPPTEQQISTPFTIPVPLPQQLQIHRFPVAYTTNPVVQHQQQPFPSFATDGRSQFQHGFQHIEHDLNEGGRRDGRFGQRDRDSHQPDRRGRDGFGQRRPYGEDRHRRGNPSDIYEEESERRREHQGRFTVPRGAHRGFGQRSFGEPPFESVRSPNRFNGRDQEDWENYRRNAYREAVRQHPEEHPFGERGGEERRYGGREERGFGGDRWGYGEEIEECEERRAFRERLDREARRRRGQDEDRVVRRDTIGQIRDSRQNGEETFNPRAVHDFHRQTATKLRVEKEKQRKKEK
ncbi:hypothetical protein PENTCL1PPCAC_1708, partial [Pristionchus entomophagus]